MNHNHQNQIGKKKELKYFTLVLINPEGKKKTKKLLLLEFNYRGCCDILIEKTKETKTLFVIVFVIIYFIINLCSINLLQTAGGISEY